jgi:Predicted membrane protein (DUF2207)
MGDALDFPEAVLLHAWVGIALVFAYYAFAAALLRWRARPSILVTKYEPPAGMSPAVAAFLWERGRYERAFAATCVALASQGFLKIEQKADCFCLHKSRHPADSTSAEESSILSCIFPASLDMYSFDAREYGHIDRAYGQFKKALEAEAKPALVSSHPTVWLGGAACAVVILIMTLTSVSNRPAFSFHSIMYLYLILWIAIGGSCFVAALRSWPATLRKIGSFLPGTHGRRRPLSASDSLPVFLTASAFLGFGFLASLTSPDFALLTAAALLVTVVSRHALESPTTAGRSALAELKGFREFLARAEADRFNRENSPGHSPEILEKQIAYAVALDVERGWGEELAEQLIELLQFDEAYRRCGTVSSARRPRESRTYPPHDSFMELGISARKALD